MANPMVEEGLIGKIKAGFGKRTEDKTPSLNVTAEFIGMNNAIPICAEACACCWDRPIPTFYADKAEYVAKRARIGHTSVLEHSNFIVLAHVPETFNKDLIAFLSWMHYLKVTYVRNSDDILI
ncbi:MAG: FAD-dependent thymidylate synthase, partial [Lachnospiraceae bacterium]|nr:FAD-dependent thymidylate synthase [Lachnospiraceae bacterium]